MFLFFYPERIIIAKVPQILKWRGVKASAALPMLLCTLRSMGCGPCDPKMSGSRLLAMSSVWILGVDQAMHSWSFIFLSNQVWTSKPHTRASSLLRQSWREGPTGSWAGASEAGCGYSQGPQPAFPAGSDGKESACNAGDPGLIPGRGKYSSTLT